MWDLLRRHTSIFVVLCSRTNLVFLMLPWFFSLFRFLFFSAFLLPLLLVYMLCCVHFLLCLSYCFLGFLLALLCFFLWFICFSFVLSLSLFWFRIYGGRLSFKRIPFSPSFSFLRSICVWCVWSSSAVNCCLVRAPSLFPSRAFLLHCASGEARTYFVYFFR